ncbi:MAG: lysophospholipid acyltransferase family protein [Acidimicrobiales bacterium]
MRSDVGAGGPRPPGRGELAFYAFSRTISVGVGRAYLPGRVLGRRHIPRKGPFILAPVHRSYVDWLLAARVTRRRLRYMAKDELWQSRIAGGLLDALGAFPVNRSGTDREALERCRQVLEIGEPLVMFPEGTRRSGSEVEHLREGVAYLALRAQVPVIPVGIGGSEQAMPRGARLPKPHHVVVVVGAPVVPPGAAALTMAPRDGGGSLEQRGSVPGAGDAGPPQRSRISRRATAEFSEQVRTAMQAAFDAARRAAGVP